MVNSQSLLSKKGALGSIWTAAHSAKRLKKEQVFQTDISSSVDKILLDEFPTVTYRILAFLLLGLVRIYSKKVEYLFHDCRDVLSELRHFVISKKSNSPIEVICVPYHSITVPERFELDAFDLEVTETSSGDHTTPREGIMRKGNKEGVWLQPVEQYHFEDALHFEDFSAGHTPSKDIYSPYSTTIDVVASTSHNLSNMVEGSRKKLRNKRFSLEECLPPMVFDEAEEAADPGRTFREEQQKNEEELRSLHYPMVIGDDAECENYVQSFDNDHENQERTHFPNLAALESDKGEGTEDPKSKFHEELQTNGEELNSLPSPMLIGDKAEREDHVHSCNEQHANMEQTNFPYLTALESKKGGEAEDPVRTLHKEHQPNGEEFKYPCSLMMVGDDVEPDDYVKSIDGKQANLEQAKLSELTAVGNKKIQNTAKECLISVSISVTPDPKAPHAAGATTPEFLGTWTPATKERVTARVLKKRKCIYDQLIVIPNNVYKENIANSRDLVKKRRKLHGRHLNKSNPMSNLPKIFFEPLIPCICVNFQSLICEKQQKTPDPNETVETSTKIDELGSLTVNRPQEEEEAIAPSTPVTHSISFRFSDVRWKTNSERVGPANSFESIGKDPSRSEDQEFDLILMNEEETNSSEGESREKNHWSARTRVVASYLHKIFLARKKRGADEIVKLSQILIGKTKRESARLFHELLVLKTGAFVNVSQDKAYDNISIMETTKLKQACEADRK